MQITSNTAQEQSVNLSFFARLYPKMLRPIVLSYDFTAPYAWANRRSSVGLLFTAFLIELGAQALLGDMIWWVMLLSLLSFMATALLPPMLGAAIAGLTISRAVVSIVFVYGTFWSLSQSVTVLGYVLTAVQLWCLFCAAVLLLTYIRTPKSKLPKGP